MSSTTRRSILKRLGALEIRVAASRPGSSIEERRARVAALDLHKWGRRYLPSYYTSESPSAHVELLRDLARGTVSRSMREDVVGSRGTAKSFVVSLLYALACAVHGAEPYELLISETAEQANLLLAAIRAELEENVELRRDYPDAIGEGPIWKQNRLVLRNGTMIESVGAGKRLRGRRQKQNRPTLVVMDDGEGDEHSLSVTRRERTARWFDGAVMKIGDASTNFVVVANAIHRESLAMKLLSRPSWKGRVWRSIVRYPDRMDLWAEWEAIYLSPTPDALERADLYYRAKRREMERGAVLLWPGRESLLELMKSRAEDRTSFEAEKQCNPVNPALCEWGDSYFDGLVWFTKWPKRTTVKSLAIDPSKGKDANGKGARRSDYSAIVKLARDPDGQLWVQADLARRDVRAIVIDAVRAHIDFRPDVAVVESNQFQSLLAPDLEEEAARQGYDVLFHPIENTTAKVVRIRSLTPYLAHKRINFYDDAGTRLLVEQLRDFPVGSHDDGPDGMEMCVRAAVDAFNVRHDGGSSNSPIAFDVDA